LQIYLVDFIETQHSTNCRTLAFGEEKVTSFEISSRVIANWLQPLGWPWQKARS